MIITEQHSCMRGPSKASSTDGFHESQLSLRCVSIRTNCNPTSPAMRPLSYLSTVAQDFLPLLPVITGRGKLSVL